MLCATPRTKKPNRVISKRVGFSTLGEANEISLSESLNSVSKPNARRRVEPRGGLPSGAEQAARITVNLKSRLRFLALTGP
jgi:hypothetical protein